MDIKKYIPTIAYFDMFDYPLTDTELEKWQINSDYLSPREVNLTETDIEQTDSFYHLKGRGDLVELRRRRYLIAEKKFTRALKFIRWFRLLPSVKMIAVCNSLAFANASQDSDIDLFIITEPGKIWLTRFWLQSFLAFFGLRPHDHGVSIRDAICLSFFVTSDNLSFDKIKLPQFALWLTQLVPVYDPGDLFKKFWQANLWVKEVLPNAQPYEVVGLRKVKRSNLTWLFSVFTLSLWENFTKKLQQKWFPEKIKQMANQDRRVIVSDKMLKFHTNEPYKELNKQWLEKLKSI